MTTEVDVNMHLVTRARAELNSERVPAGQPKLSFLSFVARAACAALAEFPDLNATFEPERLIRWQEVNLGVAVDTERGLLVPVIRRCGDLSVTDIADAIADLAERARTRRLTADDMAGGTFTISNPGSVGAASAMAIINQPQVGILGMPAIARRPWVVDGPDGEEVIVPTPNPSLGPDLRSQSARRRPTRPAAPCGSGSTSRAGTRLRTRERQARIRSRRARGRPPRYRRRSECRVARAEDPAV
jgi:pyruvate/2-oxoglutarate dehydrogenase complex dihydrolipoamide acyltransferase (E2) component